MELDLHLGGLGRDDTQMDADDLDWDDLNQVIPDALNAIGIHQPWPSRKALSRIIFRQRVAFGEAAEQALCKHWNTRIETGSGMMFGARRIIHAHSVTISSREAVQIFEKWQQCE